MKKKFRLKKMINWKVQGPIISRLLTHFAAYNGATLFLLMMAWGLQSSLHTITDSPVAAQPDTFWSRVQPVLIAMAIMLPFMVWDLMKLTNRIAGPMFRFEILLRDFVKSGTLRHARLRKGDLAVDLQKQFNEFVEALHALYPETIPVVPEGPGESDTDAGAGATFATAAAPRKHTEKPKAASAQESNSPSA